MMLVQERNDEYNESVGSSNSSSVGRVPRSLTCFLDRDLVDCCVPGDFVHVTGVVSLMPSSSSADSTRSGGGGCRPITSLEGRGASAGNLFQLCLRLNNVTRIHSRAGESGDVNGNGAAIQCLTSRQTYDQTINPSMPASSNPTGNGGVKTSSTTHI